MRIAIALLVFAVSTALASPVFLTESRLFSDQADQADIASSVRVFLEAVGIQRLLANITVSPLAREFAYKRLDNNTNAD